MSDMPPPPDPSTPAASPSPAPPPPVPAGSGGLGQPRSALLVVLLTVVTFGIWALVWSFQNGDELKRYSGRGLGGVAYLVITLFVAPVTMFLLASEVEQLYRADGKEPPITTIWGLWFLLPIIGNLIWYLRIQSALNEYWVSKGAHV
ncbi:MAG TPA: DUF4234 domain-containing protein [Ilumatobacteraceae bacterium]|nr:DUF4234 domain-containing protein [Ilumatobacteraceae bacterium]